MTFETALREHLRESATAYETILLSRGRTAIRLAIGDVICRPTGEFGMAIPLRSKHQSTLSALVDLVNQCQTS